MRRAPGRRCAAWLTTAALLLLWHGGGHAQTPGGAAPAAPTLPTPAPAAPTSPFDPQWDSAVPDLFKTRTPDSPAFVMLGISPTQIQRPTTPTDLGVSLSSFVDAQSNLTIPRNLALEVAPYWLFSHRYLTADKYESGGWRSIYRMFTLSVGTQTTTRQVDMAGTTVDQSVSDLSIGGRTRLVDGADYDAACAQKIEAASQQLSATAILPDDQLAALAAQYAPGTPAWTKAVKDAKASRVNAALAGVNADCAKVLAARTGFLLDLAGGGAWRFPDAKVSKANSELLTAGAWLSGGYTWSNGSLLGMGRVLRRAVDITDRQSVGDLGVRGIYAASRFGASLEGIYRHRFSGAGASNTYRVDGSIEYRVLDTTWLSMTFGKDFTDVTTGSLFSLANLAWGFGDRKIQTSTTPPSSAGAS